MGLEEMHMGEEIGDGELGLEKRWGKKWEWGLELD